MARSKPAAKKPAAALAPQLAAVRDCILAWDYESLALPSSLEAGAAAVGRLLELARRFGRVEQCRVYHDSAKRSGNVAVKHRASLEALGFTIVDCPTSDKKEALDKKVLVDVAIYAAAAGQRPRSVVLAASDGDYAYLLSRCRQLGGTVSTCEASGRRTPRWRSRATRSSRGSETCCSSRHRRRGEQSRRRRAAGRIRPFRSGAAASHPESVERRRLQAAGSRPRRRRGRREEPLLLRRRSRCVFYVRTVTNSLREPYTTH